MDPKRAAELMTAMVIFGNAILDKFLMFLRKHDQKVTFLKKNVSYTHLSRSSSHRARIGAAAVSLVGAWRYARWAAAVLLVRG